MRNDRNFRDLVNLARLLHTVSLSNRPESSWGRPFNMTTTINRPTPPCITACCDRNRMADLSKASNAVQEKYILYDVTGFTQICHSLPVATSCK